MNTKDNMSELDKILKQTGIDGGLPGTGGDISNELPEPEPLFDIDYDNKEKELKRRARRTVQKVVRHIVPEELIKDEYLRDKMDQDIETLADLYYQREMNIIMQRSNMECVRTGGGSARLFETFTQLSKNLMEINKQIVSTEAVLRQMYSGLKGEIMDSNRHKEAQLGSDESSTKQKRIPMQNNNLVQSPKDLISSLHQSRKQEHIEEVTDAKYYEE